MQNNEAPKRAYEAPRLDNEGSVRELTLGQAQGSQTDADFPQGTPFADLTFTN